MSDITKAIEVLKNACMDEFSVTLSQRDFERLYIDLSKILRSPPLNDKGFKFPYVTVCGMVVRNKKYFEDIQKEVNAMIDYITGGRES